jgi:hypothetical protein
MAEKCNEGTINQLFQKHEDEGKANYHKQQIVENISDNDQTICFVLMREQFLRLR